jgi:hypothetical protein
MTRGGVPYSESRTACSVLVLQPLPAALSSVARLCDLLCFVAGGAPEMGTESVDEMVAGKRTQGVLVRFERAAHARAARAVHGQRLGGEPLWAMSAHRAPASEPMHQQQPMQHQQQQRASPRKRSRSRSPEELYGMHRRA